MRTKRKSALDRRLITDIFLHRDEVRKLTIYKYMSEMYKKKENVKETVEH